MSEITSHTVSNPLKLNGVEFYIDHDNDLSITVEGWDDNEIQRWVKPENAQQLLALVQEWARNKSDEQQLTGEKS